MTVKAKFYCSNVQTFDGATASSVTLGAVCRGVENAQWSSATPAGNITMSILNDLATAQFKKGQEYEVTFEPVDAPAEGDGHQVEPVKTKHGYVVCGRCGGYPTLPGAGVDTGDPSTWPATAWDSHNAFYAVKP